MSSDVLKDRIPPHNDDAEKATLGAILSDPEAISVALNFLRPDDFYHRSHSTLFESIINIFNRGESLDILTLINELRATGLLEQCGGAAYISGLTSVVPTSANIEYYAQMVRSASVRRILIKVSSTMTAEAYDDTKEARELVEEAEKKIFEITDQSAGSHFKAAGEVITKTIDAIEKLYHTKESYTGVPSGFLDLDNMTSGFQKAEFIIIGARPSVGKTAFALTIASNVAVRKKIPIGFFTLEMSDMALMQRLVAQEARLPSEKLRSGMLRPSDFHSLTEAAGRIYEAPLYIDDTPNMKLLDLRAQARRMKMKKDIKALFIDYIGLIEPEQKGSIPRHEQVGEISRSLKSLARELDIPIVCLSQVGRQTEGKAPSLADLRESGSIEQDADVVMFLHRERGTERDARDEGPVSNIETELIVAKQRNGPVGTVKIVFLPQYTRFESLSKAAL